MSWGTPEHGVIPLDVQDVQGLRHACALAEAHAEIVGKPFEIDLWDTEFPTDRPLTMQSLVGHPTRSRARSTSTGQGTTPSETCPRATAPRSATRVRAASLSSTGDDDHHVCAGTHDSCRLRSDRPSVGEDHLGRAVDGLTARATVETNTPDRIWSSLRCTAQRLAVGSWRQVPDGCPGMPMAAATVSSGVGAVVGVSGWVLRVYVPRRTRVGTFAWTCGGPAHVALVDGRRSRRGDVGRRSAAVPAAWDPSGPGAAHADRRSPCRSLRRTGSGVRGHGDGRVPCRGDRLDRVPAVDLGHLLRPPGYLLA